jgi:hypothetical protein
MSVPISEYAEANEELGLRKYIIYVAGRAFVKGARTPSCSLEIWGSVHIAMQGLEDKLMKK